MIIFSDSPQPNMADKFLVAVDDSGHSMRAMERELLYVFYM